MITTTYTDFRSNMKGYMDKISDDADNLLIHRGSGKDVVVMSLEEYESIIETQYIMSSSKIMNAIEKGEEEIASGTYKEFNLDEL